MTERAEHFLDFSQLYTYKTCPWKWVEKKINQVEKAYPATAQRGDNLAVGSLVHAGLENWYKNGLPEIPQEVVAELGPTPDALNLCQSLVTGFVRQYPQELWKLVACEEPVRSPLTSRTDLLAKIDSYFLVEQQMTLGSGVDGYDLSLEPGYWIQEFKTKAAIVPRPKFIARWVTDEQPNFQLLALRHKLKDTGIPVRGVLISVLEKPTVYVPKRKCKTCDDSYELATWLEMPGTVNQFSCPICGNIQNLKPYEPKKLASPSYFRVAVTRSEEDLLVALERYVEVALEMEDLRDGVTVPSLKANTLSCAGGWYGPCEFFAPHTYRTDIVVGEGFQRTRDYVGESGLVTIEDVT